MLMSDIIYKLNYVSTEVLPMPRQSISDMPVSRVYPLLVQKAERKGRTKGEVDAVIK